MKVTIADKRGIAAIIDFIVICLVANLLHLFLMKLTHNAFLASRSGGILVIFSFIYKDHLFRSGSLGKKIMNLAIYDNKTNKYVSNKIKIKRNLLLFHDVEEIINKTIYNNVRFADVKYDTRVDYIIKK